MKPIAIESFAAVEVDAGLKRRVPYGVNQANAVKALRDLAKRVNRGEILITTVSMRQTASEEFVSKTLQLNYIEGVQTSAPKKTTTNHTGNANGREET